MVAGEDRLAVLMDEETSFKLVKDNEKWSIAVWEKVGMTYLVETDEGNARDGDTEVEGLPVDTMVQDVLRLSLLELSV